jgi:hypothetical protein
MECYTTINKDKVQITPIIPEEYKALKKLNMWMNIFICIKIPIFLGIILSSYFYGNKNVMFIALLFAVIDSHIIRNMIQSK